MERLRVRLTDRMFWQLDALAAERGVDRTRVVRQLLEAGLRDRPAPPANAPSEEELLDLLAEKARMGNVAAIRTLLLREEQTDPRRNALALLGRDGCTPAVGALLFNAFKALGMGPSRRELGLVATAIRESGDEEALVLWDGPDFGPGYDRLEEIAEEAGAGGFVALDLYVESDNPGAISGLGGRGEPGTQGEGAPTRRQAAREGGPPARAQAARTGTQEAGGLDG